MTPPLVRPATAAVGDSWSTGDWVLGVVLPLVLLALGVALLLRGRSTLAAARRIRAGFGGPPGSLDIGTELGFGIDNRAELLRGRRLSLWGLVLVAVGVLWLLVTLGVRLL